MPSFILIVFMAMAQPAGESLPAGAVARLGTSSFRTAATWRASFALSPDGRLLAEAEPDSVTVHDLTTGRAAYTLKDPKRLTPIKRRDGQSPSLSVAFSPDGRWLLTADRTAEVQVWEAKSGKWLKALTPPAHDRHGQRLTHNVAQLTPCPEARRVFALSAGICYLLDPDKGTWDTAFVPAGTDDITAVSGDGKTFVTHYNCDALFQECTVAGAHAMECGHRGGAWYATLNADGTRVAVGGGDLSLWDTKEKKPMRLELPVKGLGGVVRSLQFSPDGKTLLAASEDADCVCRWDVATGDQLPPVKLGGPVQHFDLTADGKTVVVVSQSVIRRFDAATLKEIDPPEGFVGSLAVALSADGKLAAVGDRAGVVRVYSAPFTGTLQTLRSSGSAVDTLLFSSDSTSLLAGTTDFHIETWNVTTGKAGPRYAPSQELPKGYYHPEFRFAVSPDGKIFVGSADQKAVWAWDAATGKILWQRTAAQEGKGDAVTDAVPTFGNDGKTLYLGLQRALIGRYDPATGKEIGKRIQLPGFHLRGDSFWDGCLDRYHIRRVVISPDGKTLLAEAYYNDAKLCLFDLADDSAKWNRNFKFSEAIHEAAFSPDGKTLLISNAGGPMRSLDSATGKEVDPTPAFPLCTRFRLSADGRLLAAPAGGATAIVWDLSKMK